MGGGRKCRVSQDTLSNDRTGMSQNSSELKMDRRKLSLANLTALGIIGFNFYNSQTCYYRYLVQILFMRTTAILNAFFLYKVSISSWIYKN